MNSYHYLVVPFQGKLSAGGKIGEVSTQLQQMINNHSDHGWEFVELTSVDILVQPGCIAGLFGARAVTVAYNQIVFRAPKK